MSETKQHSKISNNEYEDLIKKNFGLEKTKEKSIVQGVTDFIIFGSVAFASFLGGNLLVSIGWHMMLYMALIPIFILAFYIIFLWITKVNVSTIKI